MPQLPRVMRGPVERGDERRARDLVTPRLSERDRWLLARGDEPQSEEEAIATRDLEQALRGAYAIAGEGARCAARSAAP
jgi:hypothetical protein